MAKEASGPVKQKQEKVAQRDVNRRDNCHASRRQVLLMSLFRPPFRKKKSALQIAPAACNFILYEYTRLLRERRREEKKESRVHENKKKREKFFCRGRFSCLTHHKRLNVYDTHRKNIGGKRQNERERERNRWRHKE